MSQRRVSLFETAGSYDPWTEEAPRSPIHDPKFLKRVLSDVLTEKQSEYLLEFYYGGKKQREIADTFGVSHSTVSRTIARGRKRIEAALKYYVLK